MPRGINDDNQITFFPAYFKELRFEIADIWSGAAFSQLVKRHFGVSELEHLSVTDLMELEKLVHTALSQVRSAKLEPITFGEKCVYHEDPFNSSDGVVYHPVCGRDSS
ncbi:hypothetical protein CR513_36990, partial [Mucuna pruriens]